MENQLKNKIAKATAWSSVTEIVARLATPLVNLILARLLAPEAFGAVATITMIISFAELFSDAGFQKYIVQHQFSSKEELNQNTNVAFWTNLAVSCLIVATICIFRDPLAELVGSAGLGNGIAVASINIFFAAFSSIQMARYKRDFDFKTLFLSRVGSAFIPLMVTVPLSFLFRNYWALIIGTIASNLYVAIILTVKSDWKPSLYFNFKQLKEMFSFSMWTLIESITIWLTSYIDVFLVGKCLSDYYLGIYKTSMSTVNAYMGIITAATTPVLFSALSRYQDNETEFRKNFFSFQRLTAVLIFPMGVGIYMFSELVTQILLGSQWQEASGFMGLWGLTGAMVIVLSNYNGEVYRSKGNPKISLISQSIHLAFLVAVLLLSVGHGFEVLYTARALARIQGIVVGLLFMHFLYHFKVKDIFKNIFPPLFATAIMATIGFGLKRISDSMGWSFFVIAICIVVYFSVLFLAFPKMKKEIFQIAIVKKVMKKFSKR